MLRRIEKKYIERIKNVLIVVLFLTAVLLLSFFWQDAVSLRDLTPIIMDEENSYIPEADDLVRPRYILFNYGTDIYTLFAADEPHGSGTIYDEVKSIAAEYIGSAYTSEQIEASQYQEVMSYASVVMRFDYNIPLLEYLEQNDIESSIDLSDIPGMTSIGFSSASSENLFFVNRQTNTYYRIVVDDEEKISELSGRISELIAEKESSDYIPYYNMSDITGVENDALMPLYMSSEAVSVSGNREFSIENEEELSRTASGFFSSGLDFVRKITENKGAVLYMYGTSQSLIINEDGSLEYSENVENYPHVSSDFYGSLDTATEYIATHGGWENIYGSGYVPYLKDAHTITNGENTGYHFEFGLEYDGAEVQYTEGELLSADVYGSQVTSYRRDLLILPEKEQSEEENMQEDEQNGDEWYAMAPIDVLTNNYEKICRIVSIGSFEEMTADVSSIRFCCMRDRENDPLKIRPAWRIIMSDGHQLWFDAESGRLLHHKPAEVN